MAFDKPKYIYKITNKENGKIYIGQSNDPKRRFQAHMLKNSSSKLISQDVDKFGRDSFELEVIEEASDTFQDREKYWIQYYKDLNYNIYNQTKGGEEPPTQRGFDNKFTKYSEEKVLEVINLLKNTNYNFKQLGRITKTTIDFVQRINNGNRRLNDYDFDYPIRKESHFEKISKLIINDLKSTKILQREIAKKYGVTRSMVTMINIGKNRHDYNIKYPIRKDRMTSCPDKIVDMITKDLQSGMSTRDIIDNYGYENTVRRLNVKLNKGTL